MLLYLFVAVAVSQRVNRRRALAGHLHGAILATEGEAAGIA